MATAFLLFSAILGLYLRCASATNGLPDLYIPSTNGYLCDTLLFNIKFLEEEARRAYKDFTHQSIQRAFPALFEDLYLFNKHNEILLAWPVHFPWTTYKYEPTADFRLIIDSDGKIIGLVSVIYPKKDSKQKEFRKCKPLHSSSDGGDDTSRQHVKQLEEIFPFVGYLCNGAYLNLRSFLYTVSLIEKLQLIPSSTHPHRNKITFYNGNKFSGENLLGFPLRNLDSKNSPNGAHPPLTVFLNPKFYFILVKGVVSKGLYEKDDGDICQTLWDLSPLSEITPDVSSPIHRKAALVNNDGTYICANEELNISTILLQVPHSLYRAQNTVKISEKTFPILQSNKLWLWPIRFPESFPKSEYSPSNLISDSNIKILGSRYLFAIGCDLEFQVVGLFYTKNDSKKNPIFKQCQGT
ncbi:putative candidate secreted effector protein [Blumeria hordei DH14]|uniref:Putative candidate secreted effector protein n=1 Tax=Blumeria graminis f. sp. hordei (strain DH14) TaxID=546991 RepID=N1JAZ5_BLUG1|nr:putative candidate secreted effector protein [Blumeria hordei DH14]